MGTFIVVLMCTVVVACGRTNDGSDTAEKMPLDPRWLALVDSVQQDLSNLPAMSDSDLVRAAPAYHARLTRLMDLHRGIMQAKSRS